MRISEICTSRPLEPRCYRDPIRQLLSPAILFLGAVAVCSAQNTANLWIDTDGGTCTRSSTPVAYATGSACGSFSAAYSAASGGDTIYVKAGTYGSQSVPGRSIGTNVVTFAKEPGGSAVNISGTLNIDSSYVTADGFIATDFSIGHNSGCNATPGNGWPCAFPVRNVTLKNFDVKNGYITGDTILLLNGDVGPVEACGSAAEDGIQILGLGPGLGPSWTPSVNITIDNVTIHDITNNGSCGDHTDGIQGFGYRNLIVRNSRFYNTDSSSILAYSFDNSNPLQVDRILIENNTFGTIAHPGHGITVGNDGSVPCGTSNLNNIIQNNTFYGNMMADVNCSGSIDGIFRNNIVMGSEPCGYGNHQFSWDYNIFPPSGGGSGCGSTSHAKLCTPAFVNSSFPGGIADLLATDTCARDYVTTGTGTYPATDMYGTSRPRGAAVDAGAFELNTTPPPQIQPPTSLITSVQ